MAKWIWGLTNMGEDILINMDTVCSISRTTDNQTLVEWQDGNLQVTLNNPSFNELQSMLEDQ